MQYTLPKLWCFKSDMIMLFFSNIAVIQGYIKCTCIVARWFLQNIYNCYIYCVGMFLKCVLSANNNAYVPQHS